MGRAVMDVQIYKQLRESGVEEKQATVIAASFPDWSQFATKADLEPLQKDLSRLELGQAQMQTLILRKQNQVLLGVGGLLLGLPPLWLWVWTAGLPTFMKLSLYS